MAAYGEDADLYALGLPAGSLAGVDTVPAREAASRRIDDAIAWKTGVPLVSWPKSVTRDAMVLAAYDLVTTRGVNPEQTDEWLVKRAAEVEERLRLMAQGKIPIYAGLVDATPGVVEGGAIGWSEPDRGWQRTACDGSGRGVIP